MDKTNSRLPTAATPRVRLTRPKINAGQQDLSAVSAEGWQALQQANRKTPYLFLYGGVPVRVVPQGADDVSLDPLSVDSLRHHLAREADWYKNTSNGPTPAMPPTEMVRDMRAHPAPPLPTLSRVTHAPVILADHRILLTAGYDPPSLTYYAQPACLADLEVPTAPTREEVAAARRFLLEDLFGDFPFVSDASRAHTLGLAALPSGRPLIDGPTPFHLVEKPKERTGAGLLVEVALIPATGGGTAVMTLGRSEDETRRTLTARLAGSPTVILIDNATELRSAALSAAITARIWTDRLVGTSRDAHLPVECVWVATGINPALSSEIAGRSVPIRLDAQMDHPEERRGFRHPHLHEWALRERCRLMQAVLTLWQAWIAAGCPEGDETLGGFERWSRVMGGFLMVAGVEGFLQDRQHFYSASDADRAAWTHLLRRWHETFGDRTVGAGDLFSIVTSAHDPIDLDLGDGSDRSQKGKFGKLLVARRNAVIDGFQIAPAGTSQGAQQWRLIPVAPRNDGSE